MSKHKNPDSRKVSGICYGITAVTLRNFTTLSWGRRRGTSNNTQPRPGSWLTSSNTNKEQSSWADDQAPSSDEFCSRAAGNNVITSVVDGWDGLIEGGHWSWWGWWMMEYFPETDWVAHWNIGLLSSEQCSGRSLLCSLYLYLWLP